MQWGYFTNFYSAQISVLFFCQQNIYQFILKLFIFASYKGLFLRDCENLGQHQFIGTELIFFAVKRRTPTDEELEQLGIDIGKDWGKLGRRLQLKPPTLQEINKAHDQLSEKGYHMLKRWKENKGTDATYQALCDALQHQLVQRQDLAEKFCYIKGRHFLHYLTWV